jgi:ppGpp synthetase/RelA/SpoT-type nucleotidyltranferase
MALLDEFISQYRKQYDFYDSAARLVAQILDSNLQAGGVRSIVTSRAKSIIRLEAKVKQRAATKNYTDVDSIYRDIVDLAGVRVALYFPAERDQVDKLIKQTFTLTDGAKNFPVGPPKNSRGFESDVRQTVLRVFGYPLSHPASRAIA